METNNIWGQYWFIFLIISTLIIECIRDDRIDKLFSCIPKDKWNKCSCFYKSCLIRYGNSKIETNKKWLVGIILGLFFIIGVLGNIGLHGIAVSLGAVMFIITTIIVLLNSREELKQRLFRFSKPDVVLPIIFTLFPLLHKMIYSISIDILEAVRILTVWFTYWLLFRYIPLKACDAMMWLITFSKRFTLKEADKENALRNFLRFIIVPILGLCIDCINRVVDFKEFISDICYNCFFFLVGG